MSLGAPLAGQPARAEGFLRFASKAEPSPPWQNEPVATAPGVPPSDEELVAAARGGDNAALDAFVRRHESRLYRFGLKMCRNREAAGEVVQDTLLAVVRSLAGFRGEASVTTWLYTIARRACLRRRRRSRFAPEREESLEAIVAEEVPPIASPAPTPEEDAGRREIAAALDAAIGSLEPAQREVLLLRDVEGLSTPEVAAALGLRVEAVKSRLHRARLAVRRRLAPLLVPPAPAGSPASRRDCRGVLEAFSRELEGDLAPELCARLRAHLDACPPCRAACASLDRTLELCRGLPAPRPPDVVREAIRRTIDEIVGSRDRTGSPPGTAASP